MSIACVESERALVGAVLCGSKETQEWVCSELNSSEFHDYSNARLYKAIQSILDEGLEVSPISAKERSGVNPEACIEASKGISPSQLKTFIKDIKTAHSLRQISSSLSECIAECNQAVNPDVVLESLEGKIYGQISRGALKSAVDAREAGEGVLRSFLGRVQNPDHLEVSTGLTVLDRAIIGLRPKFYVLGARPSVGKSALAQTITHNVLTQEGLGVLTFSAEMCADEILERSMSHYSGVNVRKIMSGRNLHGDEMTRVIDAGNNLPRDRWRIVDKTINIGSIRRIAKVEAAKMRRKGIKLALIVIDYMQLFADGENREQAVSAVSRGCKLMSRDLDCAVLGLSQLNRGLEHRDDKRPNLSDLRESGAIEQDADAVMFLYRDCRYNEHTPEDVAELIVAKQRGGPTGTLPLKFNAQLTSFSDSYVPQESTLGMASRDEAAVAYPRPEGCLSSTESVLRRVVPEIHSVTG